MHLPNSNELPVNLLAACFNNTTSTYKFYWLLAILQEVEENHLVIPKRNLFARMISNAWFTVNYFHVSFGKQDLIQQTIQFVNTVEKIPIDEKQASVFQKLSTTTNKINLTFHNETRTIIEHPNIPRSNDKWDFGARSLPHVLERVKPEALITVNDIQMVQHIPKVLYKNEANIKIMDMPSRNLLPEEVIKMSVDRAIQEFKERYPLDVKWIMAAPQDGEPPMPQWKSIYDVADQVVAFAKYGKDIFKNYYNMDVPYIYHAIDTDLFTPDKKPEPLQDKFVIGNFNRNQPRKQPVRCIQAFAKFAKDKPDVLLHM